MIVKNENNILVPEYLNARFFRDTLEEGLREIKVNIHELNFEWGSNPGENYCSSIYRVLVTFERSSSKNAKRECISLIVKTIPVTPETKFLEDSGVFVKEMITYYDVIPRLEILCNGEEFGAKCYHTHREPVNVIVFNDLRAEGFGVASRHDGLDFDHCSLILQKLAKFHATSMVLAKKDPKIIKHYRRGILSRENVVYSGAFSQMFGSSLEQLIQTASSWDGFQHIIPKFQRYLDNFEEITAKFAAPKEGDIFTVLNHGDLWTNNFMFAYDDASSPKKPTRAIFVDFQLSFFGSPGCDINFFLYTSVQLDVLKQRRDELIEVYYDCLAATLQYLRYDEIPSLDNLKTELRQRELYGLFALYGFLPMVTMPKELSEDNTIEAMTNDEMKRLKFVKVFANEKLQNNLRYSLKRMDELGVLDEF